MTEESYQQCRKIMASANYIRGKITKQMGEVAKWTKIEDYNRGLLQEGKANGAKKCLVAALKRLESLRKKFADMKFPDDNLKAPGVANVQCTGCGRKIAAGGDELCENCLRGDRTDGAVTTYDSGGKKSLVLIDRF